MTRGPFLGAVIFFLLFARADASAQTSFGFQQTIFQPEALQARDVFAADMDGDGDVDILMASEGNGTIAWYENSDGLGAFGPQQVISTSANGARSVHAADLDGDGDVDVLSASRRDDKIAWYENSDGLGSFGPQQVISTSAIGAESVHAADLDGDGDVDVLSASWSDDKIAWYENSDGLGTFGPQQVISTSADGAESVHAADLDGDGDVDVLSASYGDDKIAWYENSDGHGAFGAQQVISSSTDSARSVHAADLDGDGDVDVLSASYSDDKIAWYENSDGLGTFGPQQVISTSADRAKSVHAADLDGDGDVDVLSASAYDGKIAWYENSDGHGAFGPQQVISTNADYAQSVHAADLDGDGDVDVLSASWSDDKIAWYENSDGLGAFGPQQVISTSADRAKSVHAADLDGDGDVDVLSASEDNDTIAWYENTDGLGTFGPQQVLSTSANGAQSVHAADLDGDGDVDVLSASAYDGKIAWYENSDGHGAFGPQQVISTSANGAQSVHAADLDGNGDVDVLSASAYDGKIAWYENSDGLGTFGPQQVISSSAYGATSVHAADLDGDSDLDVLSASADDDKIAWYENTDGLGAFGPQQVISAGAVAALSVHAADLDGDGDVDVLSASYGDDKIAWYENTDGLGAFGPQQVISTSANGAESVHAADLDGDGDVDVLSASWSLLGNEWPDDKIAWYENSDGLGAFGPQQVISAGAHGAESVHAADLDGDGDMDVLSASAFDDKIAWYENLLYNCSYDGQPCDFGAGEDGNLCNSSCSEGTCVLEAPTCDDGLFCNGVETCDAVLGCQAGTAPCDDGVACTDDSCDEVNYQCSNAVNDGACDDRLFCNGVETCDAVLGCQPGTAPDCDDGVACTDDICDEVNDWCANMANYGACDDGLFCNGAETCDAVLGCQAGTAPCDDGVACTDDSCDEVNDQCSSTADDGACDDGLFCNGVETCDAVLGCQAGTAPCDDGVACTDDSCDEDSDRCASTAYDGACDDGLFCNGVETCDADLGCVAGEDACEAGECDEAADVCLEAETCGDGSVQAGEACDDGNRLPGDGCSAECAVEDGWVCDDAEPSRCTAAAAGGCGCGAANGNSGGFGLLMLCAFCFLLNSNRRRPALPRATKPK
jgi:cysteine-rich repeat protein